MATAMDVARWMLKELKERNGWLDQSDAVAIIQHDFGEEFVYANANGNLAISKEVLSCFRKLSAEIAVWERGSKAWRERTQYDTPGKRSTE